VLWNDSDVEGDALSAVLGSNPTNGTVTLNPEGSFTYTPNANFNGTDSFTYRASDGVAQGNAATVTIKMNAVNDSPVAMDDSVTINEDVPTRIPGANLLANDLNPDGDVLVVTGAGNAVNGSVSLDGQGNVLFTPTLNFSGSASFEYTMSDGKGGTDTGFVAVNVAPVNDKPVAVNDTAATNEDTQVTILASNLLANDTDVEGDTLSITGVGKPENGTVALVSGNPVFTPTANFNGTGSFSYTISDGHGGTDSGKVTVTVQY
jgi:VCBS repeat-containing protein